MPIEELKVPTNPRSFVDVDEQGNFKGVAIARTAGEAQRLFARGDEYLRVWAEMAAWGEPIRPVITDPSTTSVAEAVIKDAIDLRTP